MIIDEFKSTSKNIDSITVESYPEHWAQARCYAYMYAKAHGTDHMQVQLTNIHVETEEQKRFRQEIVMADLESFMNEVVQCYYPYASLKLCHEQKRNKSIKELAFPFVTYRGQRKLAVAVYKPIADSRNLFAKAPTGLFYTVKVIREKPTNLV